MTCIWHKSYYLHPRKQSWSSLSHRRQLRACSGSLVACAHSIGPRRPGSTLVGDPCCLSRLPPWLSSVKWNSNSEFWSYILQGLLPDQDFGLDWNKCEDKCSCQIPQPFTGFVQRALWRLSQDPSETRTWRCHLAEDPSSGSEIRNRTKQCKREFNTTM